MAQKARRLLGLVELLAGIHHGGGSGRGEAS